MSKDVQPEPRCRICGRVLRTRTAYDALLAWPEPLLPGDVPADEELCSHCLDDVRAVGGWGPLRMFDLGGGAQ
jgi:hypothetical protein